MTDCTRLLRDLVALPSVNPMGRPLSGPQYFEYQVTAYLENFFHELQIPHDRQPLAPRRENIVARFENPHSDRTLLWEVHQDTVPVENMTIDPFGAVVEKGRLYGRGSCDVKGGMAAMLNAFARLVRERPRNAASVILACVVDEEFTFTGIQELVRRGVKADFAVVAEPTQLEIVNAHKGVIRWHLETKGRACHSSSPEQGINAIYHMGKILTGIERYAEELHASRIDPLLGPATISVGRIEGGVSVNVVPESCRIEVDRRLIGGENPAAAPKELEDFLRGKRGIDAPFVTIPPWMAMPALSPNGSEQAVAVLGSAIDSVRGSHFVTPVPYGTDAATLAAAGIPSIVFGPGDIAKAHTCDEYVPLDEVEQASEILYRLAVSQ
jgi:acetylornithine deacetylase ArgE